jgi:hypothetical protein
MPAIQVKNVPDDIHDQLRRTAEELNCTIGELIIEAITRDMKRRRHSAWLDAVLSRSSPTGATASRTLAALDAGRAERHSKPAR